MKIHWFLYILLLLSFTGFSQGGSGNGGEISTKLPDVIGPSPEVTAFAKYIDFPVSHAAGIPNIEIPIYTLSEGNLKSPVSLSYHAGGIKVSETASVVGLGWSLMAGGVVGRMIKHQADDIGSVGYMNNDFYSSEDIPTVEGVLENYFHGHDTEPDIFFFNFMEYNGKFQYAKNENNPSKNGFFPLTENNIQIDFQTETSSSKIEKFILTTPDGTKYYFGKNNSGTVRKAVGKTATTRTTVLLGDLQFDTSLSRTTAWYLMEIESITGEKILFHYENHQNLVREGELESQKYLARGFEAHCYSDNIIGNSDFYLSTTFSDVNYIEPRISSIQTIYNLVEFEYDTQGRLDFLGSNRLKKIKIKNNQTEELVKEFELEHDYFNSEAPLPGDPNYFYYNYSVGNKESRLKRLKLLSVTEKGFDGATSISLPPYTFEYNSTKLPNKFSFAQDLWGFYNGKEENGSLIPKAVVSFKTISQSSPFQPNGKDADRSVDTEKSKAGILTKINYPTGGYTEYKYENNSVSGIIGTSLKRRILYGNRLIQKNKHFYNSNNSLHEFPFTIGEFVAGHVSFKVENCELQSIGCFNLKLYDSNNQEINGWATENIKLNPGDYILKATPSGFGNMEDFDVFIKWQEDPTPEKINVGGLRIKEIIKNDNHDDVLKKTYEYNRKLTTEEMGIIANSGMTVYNNSISSGIIGWFPQVVFKDYQYTHPTNCNKVLGLCTETVVLMTSYPQKPLFEFSGNSTLYTQVTERTHKMNSQKKYKTEYFFDGEDIQFPILDYSTPIPYRFLDIFRGNLLKKKEYNNQNQKVREETHIYQRGFINSKGGNGVVIIPSRKLGQINPYAICYPIPLYDKYFQQKSYLRPKKSTTIQYFPSGEVKEKQEFSYGNSNLVLPSKSQTIYYKEGNNEKKIETFYKYPFDYPSNSLMQTLVNQNRIEKPIRVQQKNNNIYVKTTKAVYGKNNHTAMHTLPIKIQTHKGSGVYNLEDRISFDKYDSKGNVLQVSKGGLGSTKISYIRGYNSIHPLAKLQNITYDNIPTHLINNIHSASQNGNNNALKNALTALRNHYKNQPVLVETYTYHPIDGMTSATDPAGNTINYKYDAFGRLKTIRDNENKKIQSFQYIYQNGNTENFVRTTNYRDAYGNSSFKNTTFLDGLGRPIQEIAHKQSGTGNDLVTPIEYDGFGRQEKEYLPYDRETSLLTMDYDAVSNQAGFYDTYYYQNTTNPYTKTLFDNSPLNRVLKQAAPGEDWKMGSGHEIKYDYDTNKNQEVRYFKVTTPKTNPKLTLHNSNGGYYAAEQLYKTTTKDENHPGNTTKVGTIEEFKNKLGQVVLKRQWSKKIYPGLQVPLALDTYYVYDDYGNLTFVLSPKLSKEILSGNNLVGNHIQLIKELGYKYKYDHRNRMIQKTLPDKKTEYLAYDPADRVIAVGPVKSPFKNDNAKGMLHTRYDAFDRIVHTSWAPVSYFNESSRKSIENSITNVISETPLTSHNTIQGLQVYYSSQVASPSQRYYLTSNLYDKYPGWIGNIPSQILGQSVYFNNTRKPKGLETAIFEKALQSRSMSNTQQSYFLYDKKGRMIRNYTQNYLGGYTQNDTKYDFIGKELKMETRHKRTDSDDETKTVENFTYTNEDRLEKHTHRINSKATEMLSFKEYDALGQLITKKVGDLSENQFLQQVDYSYNIRGWLTSINRVGNLATGGQPQDLFAFHILYNDVIGAHADVEPLYNGNISQTFWRTASDNIQRSYGYVYDPVNRLLDAHYKIPNSSVFGSYNEHLTYDNNGNILTLKRNGLQESEQQLFQIDDLDYEYQGNQLLNVTDATTYSEGFDDGNDHNQTNKVDFEYDDYGNMIKDRNKNISEITYNHLNLPKKITFENNQSIEYIYGADGSKLRKTVTEGSKTHNTDYLDGFQYKQGRLSFFPTAEGYANVTYKFSSNGPLLTFYNYVYNYTDHLGNIRLRYTKDPQAETGLKILEEDHYYPFGLKHKGYNNEHNIFHPPIGTPHKVVIVPITPNLSDPYKYKYQGQERQDELGLNWDSFKWRYYDYAIGRFMSVDPLAENYPHNSTYAFQENKMGLGRELEGLEMVSERNQDGKSITLTYKVKPINNSNILTNNQFNTLIEARAKQTEKSFSGSAKDEITVNANVIFDNDATVTWEYIDALDVDDLVGQVLGKGHTAEIGNTQKNRTQVDVVKNFTFENGQLEFTDINIKKATQTGVHEDGHVAGEQHADETANKKLRTAIKKDPNNVMKDGLNILPIQRKKIIKNIENQQ